MAAFTYFLSNAILNEAFRNVEFSQPTTVYAALFTTATDENGNGTEVTGGAYARKSITFSAAASGSIVNSADITFATATASWGNITHFAIMTALTGGSMMIQGQFPEAKTVSTGEVFTIKAGDIAIEVG